MEKLHPKAVWLFFVSFLGRAIPLLAVLFYFGYGFLLQTIIGKVMGKLEEGVASVGTIALIVVLVILVYIILCYIWAKLTYRFWGYELSENVLKIEKGVIFKKYISIPYDRIQNVDIYRGILARILGLSDLQVQTAGYSGGYSGRGGHGRGSEGRLPGLSIEDADRLREKLIQEVKGAKQGL